MKKGIYLCKVKGLKYLNYAILYYNGECWIGCDLEVIEVIQCLELEEDE